MKIACLFLALLMTGCTTTRKIWPAAESWRQAAVNAGRHPGTWVPLAGAAVVAAGDWDQDVSDWAREETPVFGSEDGAKTGSDRFRTAAHAGMIASALAIRDGDAYWRPLAERMVWEHAGTYAAGGVRQIVKEVTDRGRPNGGDESFPSGHATETFSYIGATYRNIDDLEVAPVWDYSMKSVSLMTGVATAWARVEAGEHYPTDVLAGAALGNFVAILFHDAFLGRDFPLGVATDGDGTWAVTARIAF